MYKKLIALATLSLSMSSLMAQEDLLSLVEDPNAGKNETVFATFKTTKIGNSQSIETVKKGSLDFRVSHRFSDMGTASSIHNLGGIDKVEDIRITFDYGITNNLTVGFSRNKVNELLEVYGKWRFMEQTTNNKVPVTMAVYTEAGYTPQLTSTLYAGVDPTAVAKYTSTDQTLQRFSYFYQLMIARKFNNWLSLQVMPSYNYRNFVRADVNPKNNAVETNGLLSCGFGGRIKFTKRIALIADYFYTFSDYRANNDIYHNPLSVGMEWETGGHVFHMNFTNNGALSENNFLPTTSGNWAKGEFKFGFNISRVFTF